MKLPKKVSALFFLITGYWLLITGYCYSDTIYTEDNQEIKGIIVEDYKDRVVFSTADGEKTIMKSGIKELYYDTEEQNLIALAQLARDKGDFISAFAYYDKAFKMNPDSKAAKDGIVFLQGYLFKKDVAQKEEAVRRHNEFEERGAGPAAAKTAREIYREDMEKLKEKAGIILSSEGGMIRIKDCLAGSPAYEAGIRPGDTLIAIWGRLVGYMSQEETVRTLLEKTSLETRCTIERSVDIGINKDRGPLSGVNDLIGVDLKMRLDGLTVADVKARSPAESAGLERGDLITAINGNPTRYMPLKRAAELIKKSKGDSVKLTFRRETVMWGTGGI